MVKLKELVKDLRTDYDNVNPVLAEKIDELVLKLLDKGNLKPPYIDMMVDEEVIDNKNGKYIQRKYINYNPIYLVDLPVIVELALSYEVDDFDNEIFDVYFTIRIENDEPMTITYIVDNDLNLTDLSTITS